MLASGVSLLVFGISILNNTAALPRKKSTGKCVTENRIENFICTENHIKHQVIEI